MGIVQDVISAARSIRSEHEVHPAAEIPLVVRAASEATRALLSSELVTLRTLVKTLGEPVVEPPGGARPRGSIMSVAGEVEVLVGLRGLVDAKKEAARIEREIKKVDKDILALGGKLKSKAFVEKAPAEVVLQAREQHQTWLSTRERLEEAKLLAAELDDESTH